MVVVAFREGEGGRGETGGGGRWWGEEGGWGAGGR